MSRNTCEAASCPPRDCAWLLSLRSPRWVVNLIAHLRDFDSQGKRGIAAGMGFLVWEP